MKIQSASSTFPVHAHIEKISMEISKEDCTNRVEAKFYYFKGEIMT